MCVVVNHAAGRGDSAAEVSMATIANVLEGSMDRVRALIEHVVPLVPETPIELAQHVSALRMGVETK